MVEKAKAKKPKALAKKPAIKGKKAELMGRAREDEEQPVLTLSPGPRKPSPKPQQIIAASTPVMPSSSSSSPQPSVIDNSHEPEDQTDFDIPLPLTGPIQPRVISKSDAEPERLNMPLSRSLIRKLKEQATDEGISLEEFVAELLAESVVLRAWEIVERKNAMKGNPPGNNNQRPNQNNNQNRNNNNNNNNNNQGRGNKGHRGMNHQRYQSIMDDKASFLEYVRSQERTRR